MIGMNSLTSKPLPTLFDNHLSVTVAAEYSGYSEQYLRRLLRTGRLSCTKLGQTWLIEFESLKNHLSRIEGVKDRRFGPRREN